MDYSTSNLFYNGHFWVLISETRSRRQVWIARHVFGSEPSSAQVLDFVRHDWPNPEVLDEAESRPLPRTYGFKKQLHKNRARQDSGRAVSKAKQQQNLLISQQRLKSAAEGSRKIAEAERARREQALIKRKQKRRGG